MSGIQTHGQVGRPSIYTPELAQAICEAVAMGESLRAIEAKDGMPTRVTIWEWKKKPDFLAMYSRAREQSAESLEDEILDRLRNAQTQEQALCGAKFLEAIKWAAGKRNPQVYGEKVTHEFTGELTVSVDVGDQLSRVLELQRLVGLAPQIEGTAEPVVEALPEFD